jgi:hypothetical protein
MNRTIYAVSALSSLISALGLIACSTPSPEGFQLPPGTDVGAMQRMYERGMSSPPSAADARLSCDQILREITAYMQAVEPQTTKLGQAAKRADDYQKQAMAQQMARAPLETTQVAAGVALDQANPALGGQMLQAYHQQKAVEGMARQPQSAAIRDEVMKASTDLINAQPEDRTVRMMQLTRLSEDKGCPPPILPGEG